MLATMGASVGSEGLLTQIYKKIACREGDPPATVLLMGWDNLPNQADKSLNDLTTFCQENEALGPLFGGYIFDINNLLPYLG